MLGEVDQGELKTILEHGPCLPSCFSGATLDKENEVGFESPIIHTTRTAEAPEHAACAHVKHRWMMKSGSDCCIRTPFTFND
ncbi:hypothetical protein AMELA_G00066980 [Ameiurus melas]|uniref:Uncharacterized protein n=1 Tax=Ameiurus melas TaxID=219545 RepID=A0A7J6B5T4_AMEME|nr:hypothetical protein AMELA_G00066980 [Ameiurus melas]